MELRHIKPTQCPECGATVIGEHCRSGLYEKREFECEHELTWSLGSGLETNRECRHSKKAKLNRELMISVLTQMQKVVDDSKLPEKVKDTFKNDFVWRIRVYKGN